MGGRCIWTSIRSRLKGKNRRKRRGLIGGRASWIGAPGLSGALRMCRRLRTAPGSAAGSGGTADLSGLPQPGRRRSDDRRSAEEGEMTTEQFEFVMAIETYKKVNKRMYPTWTEVLEVINQLGYRKVEHRDIRMENVPEPELLRKSA